MKQRGQDGQKEGEMAPRGRISSSFAVLNGTSLANLAKLYYNLSGFLHTSWDRELLSFGRGHIHTVEEFA